MVRKVVHFFAPVAALSAFAAVTLGATAWMGPTYTLGIAHIHQTGQTVSGNLDLALQHDTPCDVTIHLLRAGGEVLTAPGGETLPTSYMLTGDCLLNADSAWISASDFRNRIYHVKTNGPTTDVLHLFVQGQSPVGPRVASRRLHDLFCTNRYLVK